MYLHRMDQTHISLSSLLLVAICLMVIPAQPIILWGLNPEHQEQVKDKTNPYLSTNFETIGNINRKSASKMHVDYVSTPGKSPISLSSEKKDKKLDSGTSQKKSSSEQREPAPSINLPSVTGLETLNTSNDANPKTTDLRTDSFQPTLPNGFENQTGYFNISSITAENDWQFYQTDTANKQAESSNVFAEIAMEFTIPHDYANVSSVMIYFDQQGYPTGKIYVLDSTGGLPDDSNPLTEEADLPFGHNEWSDPIEITMLPTKGPLEKGHSYFVVIRTTFTDTNNFYDFYFTRDEPPDYGIWCYKWGGTWYDGEVGENRDYYLKVQILPVENVAGDWIAKTFSEADLAITYKTSADETQLTSFTDVEMNLTVDNNHEFQTNVSTTFNLDWIIYGIYLTSLTENTSGALTLRWTESTTIEIEYKQTDGTPISSATVQVNSTAAYESSSKYYLNFESSNFPGISRIGTYTLSITATRTGYQSQATSITVTITKAPSTIEANGGALVNGTTIIRAYADSDSDAYVLALKYYNVLNNDPIYDPNPTVQTSIPYGSSYANDIWTFTFNPDKTGDIAVTVSFNNINHEDSGFRITLRVNTANTALEDVVTPNTVTFGTYFVFSIRFRNTDYNENIAGVSPTINDTTKLTFLYYSNGHYWFNYTYSYAHMGTHFVQITFQKTYHVSQVAIIQFETVIRTTTLQYAATLNDQIALNYSYVYPFTITFYDQDGTTAVPNAFQFNDSGIIEVLDSNSTGDFFQFNGSLLAAGLYSLQINWTRYGYINQSITLTFNVTFLPTDLRIPSGQPNVLGTSSMTVNYSYPFVFALSYYDLNRSMSIEDFNYVIIGNLVLLESNSSGAFFLFNGSLLSLDSFNVSITFSKNGCITQIFTYQFIVQTMTTNLIIDKVVVANQTNLIYQTITNVIRPDQNLAVYFNWTDSNQIPVEFATILVHWNETQTFTGGSTGQLIINYLGNGQYLLFFQGNQISDAFYNISVEFVKYGYQNSSFNFNLTLIPYIVWLEAEIPASVLHGSDLIFKATISRSSESSYSQTKAGEGISDVTILLNITYISLDGTQKTLMLTNTSNDLGEVIFVINGITTAEINVITEILVYYDDITYGLGSLNIEMSQFPLFVDPPLVAFTRLLPLIVLILAILAMVIIGLVLESRYDTNFRETRIISVPRALEPQETRISRITSIRKPILELQEVKELRNLKDLQSLRFILIRTKDGLSIYSENFQTIKGDEVTPSAIAAAISSFIQDITQKTQVEPDKSPEFDEMTKEGFNLLAREGKFTSIIVLSDMPLSRVTKENLRSLQKDLEATLHDELENVQSVEDLDLDLIEFLVEKHLFMAIFKNIQINEAQIVQKIKLFTPTERKIIELLNYVPRIAGTDFFTAESFLLEMKRREIPKAEGRTFLMKLNQLGLLSSLSKT